MVSLPIGYAGPPQDVLYRIAAADVVRKPGPGGDEYVRDRRVVAVGDLLRQLHGDSPKDVVAIHRAVDGRLQRVTAVAVALMDVRAPLDEEPGRLRAALPARPVQRRRVVEPAERVGVGATIEQAAGRLEVV